ncbi:MAG TPA: tail fiber domain-containing protein [Myxococcales bacterium]|jgi:hypothetical protein
MKRFLTTLAFISATGFGSSAFAADPVRAIPYTGHLEVDGQGPNASLPMKFALWDAPSAGNKLFEESQTVGVVAGTFAVVLGKGPALPDSVYTAAALFVEVTVDATTLTPRQQIYAAPQSVRGRMADNFTASSVASGVVTVTDKLGVGTTAPTDKLHVVGSQRNEGDVKITGKVGIGTATPTEALHVVGNIRGDGRLGVGVASPVDAIHALGAIRVENGGTTGPSFTLVNPSKAGSTSKTVDWHIYNMTGSYGDALQFWTYPFGNNGYPVLVLGDTGQVSISGALGQISSRSYKQDIDELGTTEAVALLGQLRPAKYKYKAPRSDGTEHLGFIAEEVPKELRAPDAKSIYPLDMVAVLAKVDQSQQAELERLRLENQALKAALVAIERRLGAIEGSAATHP